MTVQRIQRLSVSLGVLVALLVAAPAAMGAAGAAQSAYDEAPPLGDVRGATGTTGPDAAPEPVPVAESTATAPSPTPVPVADTEDVSGLPFTGLELAIIALLGTVLVGTGLLVRRASRTTDG